MAGRSTYGAYVIPHQEAVAEALGRIKSQVCRICDLSPEAYDEMHYDLAEEWFRYHDYLEYTARVLMLSPSYHRWWNQQLAFAEDEFLIRYTYSDIAPMRKRKLLFKYIILRNTHPSSELLRKMHGEGTAKIKANPDLMNLKIYRHGTPS